MKSLCFVLLVVLVSFATAAFAQSDALKSFDKLKTLAGSWEGLVSVQPPAPDIDGKLMQVMLRTTSMGNALMHEMTGAGRPDDPPAHRALLRGLRPRDLRIAIICHFTGS